MTSPSSSYLRDRIASEAVAFIEAVEKVDKAHPDWEGITNGMDPSEATKFEKLQRSVRQLKRLLHVA